MATKVQAAASTGGPRSKQRQERLWGYSFTSIWLIGFLVFSAAPLLISVFISFTDWNPIRGPFWQAHLNGVHNYQTLLQDRRYWHAVWNTIYYALGSVALVNLASIPLAILLNQSYAVLTFIEPSPTCRPSCPRWPPS
jgi:multiple sugar transport system permease protein